MYYFAYDVGERFSYQLVVGAIAGIDSLLTCGGFFLTLLLLVLQLRL